MDITQFQNLLAAMPVGEDIKSQALSTFSQGKKEEARQLISSALNTEMAKLDAENPEAAAEYKAAEDEYKAAVEKATEEFNKEMEAAEKESEALTQSASAELDAIRMEEVKENIQSS